MAGEVRGQRILEVGCATGALSQRLVELGATVVGVDVRPEFIAVAEARGREYATFHATDLAEPMPFLESGSFDTVVASLVMHYLRDWETPLREFARVLRPSGALVISTHHPMQDIELAEPPATDFDTMLLTDTWHKGGRPFTVRFWHRPLSAIVDALADAGVLVERIPEPVPEREAFAAPPEFYARLASGPWFLFLRAIKVGP